MSNSLFGKCQEIKTRNDLIIKTFDLSCFESLKKKREFLCKNSGIYCWFDEIGGKIYIGSAKRIWNRFLTYRCCFNNKSGNCFSNRLNLKMRNFIKKYGTHRLKFYILEIFCGTQSELRVLEQKYLDKYKPFNENGFNVADKTKDYIAFKFKKETRDRITALVSGENSSLAILNNENVIDIKKSLAKGEKLKVLAKKYGVSTTVISNIKRKISWKHIKISDEEENKLTELSKKSLKNKYSEDLVKKIKLDLSTGMKMTDIAKKYNVSYTGVSGLKYGHFYKDIIP